MNEGKRIKVLVVDDSAVVRQVVGAVLRQERSIELIGVAPDPIFAMEKMKTEWPDVIVLDVEMPRMDGITFLKKLMSERPTPVVICSTLTERGAETTLQAMSAGACEIITKPKIGLKTFLEDSAADLVRAVKAAAQANCAALRVRLAEPAAAATPMPAPSRAGAGQAMAQTTQRVVAIGTSTGGTQALEVVLTRMPRVSPGMVIVQHMPERFTAAFAARLDRLCEIEVKEAADGDRVVPGRALLAPGGRHMQLRRSGAYYYADVRDGPLVNRHRPSVDVLFRSVARAAGRNALGVIMTGMGDDGARGLKDMREAGADTCAQDEASCVVFGMPREAIRMGAAQDVCALDAIPQLILRAA